VEFGREGNPKAETRNPKEARNPKSELVGLRGAGSLESDEPELRLEPLNWRSSGFGGRISGFGFRALSMSLFHSVATNRLPLSVGGSANTRKRSDRNRVKTTPWAWKSSGGGRCERLFVRKAGAALLVLGIFMFVTT